MILYDSFTDEILGDFIFDNLFFGKRFFFENAWWKVYGMKVKKKIMGVYVIRSYKTEGI